MVLAHAGGGTIENRFAITHVYRFSRRVRHAVWSSARAVAPIDIRKNSGRRKISGDILRTRIQVELLPMIAAAFVVEFLTAGRNLYS
jgi:hypothetical protein